MYENVSQALYSVGLYGYVIIVPILRMVATLLMAFSTYQLLKARKDPYKWGWMLFILISPILARITYEIYRRFHKKEGCRAKGSVGLLIGSLVSFFLMGVLLIMSIIHIGAGYIKSVVDDEPLMLYYDVHGNEYQDLYEVPLYDRAGNRYTHELAWFTAGTYVDQNGKEYDGDFCYLSEDGYFYFDAKNQLETYGDSIDYYTDGELIYYGLFNRVYWEADGSMVEYTGKRHLDLFDFND